MIKIIVERPPFEESEFEGKLEIKLDGEECASDTFSCIRAMCEAMEFATYGKSSIYNAVAEMKEYLEEDFELERKYANID